MAVVMLAIYEEESILRRDTRMAVCVKLVTRQINVTEILS